MHSAVKHGLDIQPKGYRREDILPRLIPFYHNDNPTHCCDAETLQRASTPRQALRATIGVMRALQRALNHQRACGRRGSWLYDVNLHINLSRAYAAERAFAYALLDRAKAEARQAEAEASRRFFWGILVPLAAEV